MSKRHPGRSALPLIASILAVVALAALPSLGNAYLTTFVFSMLIAYVLAQSWDWISGEMGYVNLGHYCFYGIGAYIFAITLVAHYPVALAMIAAVAVTAIVALLVAFPLFRLRGDYFAFATLALLPLAEILAFNLPLTNGADGLTLPIQSVLVPSYLIALALCVVAFALTVRISASRFGYALKSIRNDEEVAEIVGVRIVPVKVRLLALSAAFAALAGAVQAWQMTYIDPPTVFGLNVALIPVAMVLFGGSGLRWGPLIGVIALACLQQWLLINMQALQATVYGAIILLIGRFLPGGMLRSAWLRQSRWLGGLSQEHHEYLLKDQQANATTTASGASLPLASSAVNRTKPLLECRKVRMEFGGNVAVDNVSFRIMEGEIVGLIGPNGSGKTTLFNCISKVYEPTGGSVVFCGENLNALQRDEIARLGVGRTYQIPRPFGDLTVQENIAIPLMFHDHSLSPREAFEQAREFVAYAELSHRLATRSDTLSLQEKKALEFARALACKPRLLLVDEVASGLASNEVKRFVEHIRHVRDRYGITVIWVEHIFSALAQVVDRVIVLEQGSVIADGTLDDVVHDERVLATYLGGVAAKGGMMLEVRNIAVDHGKLRALWDVSLRVDKGSRVALLGANGAGKSTTLGAIVGLYPPASGTVCYDGRELTGQPTSATVAQGITLVPEGRRLFPGMTVFENLAMGAYTPAAREQLTEAIDDVFALFPVLKEKQRQYAGELSGGQQQQVAIGRALMCAPRTLLLDEPFIGVAPRVIEEILEALRCIADTGLTIVLVEQNVHRALDFCQRAYVIENGRTVLEGDSEALKHDPGFSNKFLGLD